MSYSVADVEDPSTDSDDEEYIPEDSELQSCESDPEWVAGKSEEPVRRTKVTHKRRQRKTRKRKCSQVRKYWEESESEEEVASDSGKKEEEEEEEEEDGDKEEEEEDDEEGEEEEEEEEEVQKKEEVAEAKKKARIDELWASFKQGTTLPSKSPSDTKGKNITEVPAKKIKIQKSYDFAGEEIIVDKEVPIDSKEARQFLQSTTSTATSAESVVKEEENGQGAVGTMSSASSAQTSAASPLQQPLKPHSVRSSGLSSVLTSIGKKPKMSTLEKSSLDWDKFKKEHRLEEELAQSSKDGYLARQEFLQWSDMKQFELEKSERLKRFKKLC